MKLTKNMLEQILRMHCFVHFVHDGWCECAPVNSPRITREQWAQHVAEIIQKREDRLG